MTGTKAAVYGGLGVILGAGGGLTADFVTTGEMSLAQIGRGLIVLAVLVATTLVIVFLVETFLSAPEDPEDQVKQDKLLGSAAAGGSN